MVTSLVLDTNVWLDYYLPFRAGHGVAGKLLTFAATHNTNLLYAAHSVVDIFYIVEAQTKRAIATLGVQPSEESSRVAKAMAYDAIKNLGEIATAVGVDQSDMWLMQKYYRIHPDIEDDLIMAAAIRARADYLITNDKQLLQHAVVPVLTPEDFLRLVKT